MIIVYQIIIGNLPERLIPCVESVKRFADRNGFKYKTISKLSSFEYGEKNIRNLSDFEKVNILSTKKYSIVIDWDILIQDDFDVKFEDAFLINPLGDCLLYNGKDTETFKILQKDMHDNFNGEHESGQLFKSWNRCIENKVIKINDKNIINSGFYHQSTSKFM